jgi:hypothetical protein
MIGPNDEKLDKKSANFERGDKVKKFDKGKCTTSLKSSHWSESLTWYQILRLKGYNKADKCIERMLSCPNEILTI